MINTAKLRDSQTVFQVISLVSFSEDFSIFENCRLYENENKITNAILEAKIIAFLTNLLRSKTDE